MSGCQGGPCSQDTVLDPPGATPDRGYPGGWGRWRWSPLAPMARPRGSDRTRGQGPPPVAGIPELSEITPCHSLGCAVSRGFRQQGPGEVGPGAGGAGEQPCWPGCPSWGAVHVQPSVLGSMWDKVVTWPGSLAAAGTRSAFGWQWTRESSHYFRGAGTACQSNHCPEAFVLAGEEIADYSPCHWSSSVTWGVWTKDPSPTLYAQHTLRLGPSL